ncbi:type II toxin-antitoxin system HipA family toxin [Blastomonas fulva]|uniref:Phosphatidylinositol kinase n=1 Tax=Blastomonas fulva TaxID=1550728 RepID=A0ABM6M358_9SPHN|nr:type II toxin-antitoxin system HipA family toxin [Blastomonas fulva]ASR50282.1 phosphatidylinositol kinase [Blastomonas fulva]
MADVEVHIALAQSTRRVGTLYAPGRGGDRAPVVFEYHPDWLGDVEAFSLEPALQLGRGAYAPPAGLYGSIGDSAPDTWGRRLMQRAERKRADREGRNPRTLTELDYLLGVSDRARLGALRFRDAGDGPFLAEQGAGVPGLVDLGNLLAVTERIERDEESEEDLRMIFAPGSSLGGARPKASVLDQHGALSIAKFAKETDDYRIELWEAIALDLARQAGIAVADFALHEVVGKPVLISRRFDRDGERRIPFVSALSMMGIRDGERASYPELVDVLTRYGANAAADAAELYRRMIFNVLVSNVDDHGRNHGFLWQDRAGWVLSPAYDLNPVPTDLKARVLSTNISLDEATCDLGLALSVAEYFGLKAAQAKEIVSQVALVVRNWARVAEQNGARPPEIKRMASAFEHDDLAKALAL